MAQVSKSDMKSSYRIAQELFKDRLRKHSPETLELLEDVHGADVIVVGGQYDHIEQVLDAADTPYTLIQTRVLDKAKLRPDQVVFINCPGNVHRKGLQNLREFVQGGGFLFTTDWALKHVIEPAFPGFIAYNNFATADEVVRVEILDREDSFMKNILDEQDDPQWWLEGSSYPIEILDPEHVHVLIRSKDIEEKYGEAPVLVSFGYGEGQIYHMISHFYLQRSETRTARHAEPSTSFIASKGISPAEMEKFQNLGSDDFPTSEVESAYTSYAMIKAVILKKRMAEEARKKRGKK